MSASSPRALTSLRMAAAASSTDASASRRPSRRAANSDAKVGFPAVSLRGMDGLAETVDEGAHRLGERFERGAIDDEARGDVGDVLDLDETVRFQGTAGLDEIDNLAAKTDARSKLHGAIELDAFRLDPAGREMAAGNLGIFGGDPDMAPARRLIRFERAFRGGDNEAAEAHLEIERRVKLGVARFHEHIVAGDAEMSGTEGDEGRDVEIPDADHIKIRLVGGEAKLA